MLNFAKKVVSVEGSLRGARSPGGPCDASGESGMPVTLADCVVADLNTSSRIVAGRVPMERAVKGSSPRIFGEL